MGFNKNYFHFVALFALICASEAGAPAQQNSCQVDRAFQAKNIISPPTNQLNCQVNLACTAYIDCAYKIGLAQTSRDPRRSDPDWQDMVAGHLSAVLDKLPPPDLNPKLIEAYYDFFFLISLPAQRSHLLCVAANTQFRNFGPTLLVLRKPLSERKKLIDDRHRDQVDGVRDFYEHSPCADFEVLHEVMNPSPQESPQGDDHQVIALLLTQVVQLNKQVDSLRQRDSAQNTAQALPTNGEPK
jgi:hypothetical protein